MSAHYYHILLLGIFFLVSSCSKEVTQEELIEGAVKLKIDQWRITQMSTCKEEALIEAGHYVDSILLVTSLDDKLDTIPKPLKPVKPFKPSFKEKPDSVIVDPIYKKE
jgi:hypothetical protein